MYDNPILSDVQYGKTTEFKGSEPLTVDASKHAEAHKTRDMAPFWGSIERDARHSVAGTLALAGCYYGDQYHRYDVQHFGHYQAVVKNFHNTTVADGTPLAELTEDAYERIADFAYGVVAEFADPAGIDTQSVAEFADDVVNYMLWEAWFKAGKVEEVVADALEERYDTEVLRISRRYDDSHPTAISEVTDFENPEARGIDLYLPEYDTGVQVKTGDGGAWMKERDKIHADVVARVFYEDNYLPVISLSKVE